MLRLGSWNVLFPFNKSFFPRFRIFKHFEDLEELHTDEVSNKLGVLEPPRVLISDKSAPNTVYATNMKNIPPPCPYLNQVYLISKFFLPSTYTLLKLHVY